MRRGIQLLAMAWGLAACAGGDTDDGADARAATDALEAAADSTGSVDFAAELGVDTTRMTRTPSGVFYGELTVGRGATAASGKRVTVEYRAWLPNGTLYEQRPNAEGWGASEFILGTSAPVRGLDEGIGGMRVGGVRKIVIPPQLGYGLVGRPAAVPEGSTLIYEIKLLKVEDG